MEIIFKVFVTHLTSDWKTTKIEQKNTSNPVMVSFDFISEKKGYRNLIFPWFHAFDYKLIFVGFPSLPLLILMTPLVVESLCKSFIHKMIFFSSYRVYYWFTFRFVCTNFSYYTQRAQRFWDSKKGAKRSHPTRPYYSNSTSY